MKPNKFRVVVLVFVVLVIGGAIWLARHTPEYVATATLTVIPASKADATKPVAQAEQVELPKAAAVAAKGETDAAPAKPADPNAAAQAELKAAFLDMGRLIRAGDYATFKETYGYIAPSQSDLDDIQRAREHQVSVAAARARDPDNPLTRHMQQLDIAGAQSYEALANQTPTFNSAGDEATYQYIAPDYYGTGTYTGTGEPTPMTFIKIDGRWYAKPANYKKPDSQGK